MEELEELFSGSSYSLMNAINSHTFLQAHLLTSSQELSQSPSQLERCAQTFHQNYCQLPSMLASSKQSTLLSGLTVTELGRYQSGAPPRLSAH